MSLKALKTELLNTTPFAQLGQDLRPVPAPPQRQPPSPDDEPPYYRHTRD